MGQQITPEELKGEGADADKFAADEKIIDEIWGSFEMWSDGASKT